MVDDDGIEWVDFNRKAGTADSDSDDVSVTGVDMGDDEKEVRCHIMELEDKMDGVIRPRGGGGSKSVSLTQVGIDELKEDLEDLKAKMNRKKPAKSENQLEIAKLKTVVKELKTRLEDQELYAGSLENDLDNHVRELEAELRKERKLRRKAERENREYQRVYFPVGKRGKY